MTSNSSDKRKVDAVEDGDGRRKRLKAEDPLWFTCMNARTGFSLTFREETECWRCNGVVPGGRLFFDAVDFQSMLFDAEGLKAYLPAHVAAKDNNGFVSIARVVTADHWYNIYFEGDETADDLTFHFGSEAISPISVRSGYLQPLFDLSCLDLTNLIIRAPLARGLFDELYKLLLCMPRELVEMIIDYVSLYVNRKNRDQSAIFPCDA